MNQKGISSIVIIFIIVGLLVIAGGIWYWQNIKGKPLACPQDAKICPDGSTVGRTGPECEFADCPSTKAKIKFSFLSEVEKPEYFDNDVNIGDHLYYRIEAIDEIGKVAKYYAPDATIIPQTTTTFNKTKDLWAWGTETYINLKWNPYDFKKFKIYRGIPITDETANWKTYRNEEYESEVKYPENWKFKEEYTSQEHLIKFEEKELGAGRAFKSELVISIVKSPFKSFEEWSKSFRENYSVEIPTEIIDSGINALISPVGEGCTRELSFFHDGIEFSFLDFESGCFGKGHIQKLMISTFKFIK